MAMHALCRSAPWSPNPYSPPCLGAVRCRDQGSNRTSICPPTVKHRSAQQLRRPLISFGDVDSRVHQQLCGTVRQCEVK